jgi:heme/copper-type cytochrome/quinol oxidase subunit 4
VGAAGRDGAKRGAEKGDNAMFKYSVGFGLMCLAVAAFGGAVGQFVNANLNVVAVALGN